MYFSVFTLLAPLATFYYLLLNKISENFPTYSRNCVKNFLILSLCILLKETVNLNKLKGVVGGVLGTPDIQADSGYKRLIRIFDNYAFSRLWLDILSFVFKLLSLEGDYLLLDGTSWKRGEKIYHYLLSPLTKHFKMC
jgi:hypothetical protein